MDANGKRQRLPGGGERKWISGAGVFFAKAKRFLGYPLKIGLRVEYSETEVFFAKVTTTYDQKHSVLY